MSAVTNATPSAGSSKIGKAASLGRGVQGRARRVVRRRGRGRRDGIESDDEIERETLSDMSDFGDHSLTDDSATDEDDSDAETEPESVLGNHAHADTPSTTQSPPPGELASAAALEGLGPKAPASPPTTPAFLSAGMDWNDMVADEGVNGDVSVPVIDFADFNEHTRARSPSHSRKSEEAGPSSFTREDGKDRSAQGPRHARVDDARLQDRQPSLSARQAYQSRLQSDPSFVPRVGEFWGHDDRLLQKDLRSLSGWWRGRWQGRGRGGPVGRGFRGRGGFFARVSRSGQDGEPSLEEHTPQVDAPDAESEVPPIDKPWTHDGFEEMKARDDRRHTAAQRGGKPFSRGASITFPRGGFAHHPGRGQFIPRRGSFSPSPTFGRRGQQNLTPHQAPRGAKADRTWFAMKPERIWTKQYEGFLYFDPELKPKPGKSIAYRVSLPGKGAEVIRVNAATVSGSNTTQSIAAVETQGTVEGSVTVTEQSRTYIVRVPSSSDKGKSAEIVQEAYPEPLTTVEELSVESLQISATIQSSTETEPVASTSAAPAVLSVAQDAQHSLSASVNSDTASTPGLTRNTSISEHSMPDIPAITAQTTERPLVQAKDEIERPQARHLPPLQTVFSPPMQPSPTYGSPYNFNPSLPPGVALNQQGFAYEIATGMPVYLHPTPPPVPLYNPRPMAPPGVFVPGHVHHPSLSADFLQAPHTPPVSGFVDLATGQPLFSLPRQSSRVEIRAPTDTADGKGSRSDRGPSKLRNTTTVLDSPQQLGNGSQYDAAGMQQLGPAQFVPPSEYFMDMSRMSSSHSYAASDGALSVSPGNDNGQLATQPMDPNMVAYPAYPQQPYYYTEQYYPAYVDMSQQSTQYDPYADQRHQPSAYY